jgi:hypothetical protein
MGEVNFGWLSGFANWRYATFVRRLGEAAAPGEGSAGRAPTLHPIYTLAFALQLRKITEKPQSG